jgi:predicted patatin/cPLA2 family phospholipase
MLEEENMINGTIVLEGGGTKGVFTAGVLDYLMEQDIYFSDVVGVSSGSCNAVDYVSRQIGRSRDCIILEHRSDRYIFRDRLLTSFNAIDLEKLVVKFANKTYPFDFETFSNSPINCHIVATNAVSGQAKYFQETENLDRLLQIIKSSCSLPIACNPQLVDNTLYFDGGVKDAIPIEYAKSLANDKIVVVLTKTMDNIISKQTKIESDMFLRMYKEYPFLCADYLDIPRRDKVIYDELVKLEDEGKIFIIRPVTVNVGVATTNKKALREFYDQGYNLTRALRCELDKYLNS